MITVNMVKARNIWRDRLRAEREPLMDKLDKEWSDAERRGDTAKIDAVNARKQALLDAPQDPRIDSAATPQDLKLITLPET